VQPRWLHYIPNQQQPVQTPEPEKVEQASSLPDPVAPQRAAPPPPPETGPRAKTTGLVSIAILCSRVLGLIRDQVLTGMFGTFFNGLFTAAFRTPEHAARPLR
jgi:hypothetical protein